MDFFHFLDNVSIGTLSLASLLSALLIFLICCAVIRLLTRLLDRILSGSKLDETVRKLVVRICRTVLWIVAVIMTGDALGIDTASLVALVSVVGLALSLAVQNIMSNVFSGITLLVARPFGPGDYVDIGANSGTVKRIGLFYTVMDTVDNRIVNIPNSDVTSTAVVNYSAEPLRRAAMKFSASYDASTEEVRSAIMDAVAMDGRIMTQPEPLVEISAFNDSSVEYLVRIWCRNEDYWGVYYAMNEHVRQTFEKHGVEMSYPHVNVHVMK